jgi:CRISPR-associated protein Csx14
MTMLGFPLTELLAVIGLQNARPQIFDKLSYRYGISAARLPTILARPILGGTEIGFPMRTFRLQLARPGKASKMRCIINAQEELHS